MSEVTIRFYAELNDLLPHHQRQVPFTCAFNPGSTVKHLVEALGVPHTEIDLILVNGVSVNFSHQVEDGDSVSVYPVFESFNISPLVRLRPQPLRDSRFILDTHLGRLAAYLRMLGFNTLYENFADDDHLAFISNAETRILLTRDRGLLKRNLVTHGYYVRSSDPRQQIVEVLQRFDLGDQIAPFRRCLRCNTLLLPVGKAEVEARLLPDTRTYYQEFQVCPSCEQIYWKGSHYQNMLTFIQQVKGQVANLSTGQEAESTLEDPGNTPS
jgi:uncharacterized protein